MTLEKRRVNELWKGNGNENTKWTSMLTADMAGGLFCFGLQKTNEGLYMSFNGNFGSAYLGTLIR